MPQSAGKRVVITRGRSFIVDVIGAYGLKSRLAMPSSFCVGQCLALHCWFRICFARERAEPRFFFPVLYASTHRGIFLTRLHDFATENRRKNKPKSKMTNFIRPFTRNEHTQTGRWHITHVREEFHSLSFDIWMGVQRTHTVRSLSPA